MKTLILTLALAVSLSFNSAGKILCHTQMGADKWYSIEEENGKTYFVTYSRMHETAAHTRRATLTDMDCNGFASWCAENNLTLVK